MVKEHDFCIKGILVTHSHIDHIYGINNLFDNFPSIKVYSSADARMGMQSSILNLSEYLEIPYIVKIDPLLLKDQDEIELWDGIMAIAHYTPGHNSESMSFQINNNLFTGDALIPGIKVYTKFKGGNKKIAQNTIRAIIGKFPPEQVIWPGHGQECFLKDCKIVL